YRTRYGFHVPGRDIVIETLSVEARGRTAAAAPAPPATRRNAGTPAPRATRPVYFDGARVAAPFYDRDTMSPGDTIAGPAILCERNTTVVVERGWSARLTDLGD